MPAPLDPAKREAILEALRANVDATDKRPRSAIAHDLGVAPSTITKVARDHGIDGAFDRTQTKNATTARTADMAAERTRIAGRLLRAADRFLDQLDEPHLAFSFGGKDNVYTEHQFERPPVDAARQLMTSAAIALDKHLAIDKYGQDDQGHTAVDEWLRGIIGGGVGDALAATPVLEAGL